MKFYSSEKSGVASEIGEKSAKIVRVFTVRVGNYALYMLYNLVS